jgi:23S rRNA (uracil1939-C5)-methyltransferase
VTLFSELTFFHASFRKSQAIMNTQIRFEKIVPSGQAMAHFEGRAWFCLGALPGELCEVKILRQSKTFVIAGLEKVLEPSEHRDGDTVGPEYAPWQPVTYEYQLELKTAMLSELFGRPGVELPVSELIASPIASEYRNKLTFALVRTEGVYALGMHQRGSKETYLAPKGCSLGDAALNDAALAVLDRINKSDIGDNAIGLTVRRSTADEIIAILALGKRYKIDFQSLRAPGLAGLVVTFEGKAAWSYGAAELTEDIAGVPITFPAHEFMQVNITAFELALAEITKLVDKDNTVLDLYGGAGTIGLSIAKTTGAKVLSVELNMPSVELSRATAKALEVPNFKATSANADGLVDSLFMNVDTLIVDPPRAGLSRDLIDQLIRLRIERVIYISCDPATQARDTALMSHVYKPSAVTGFDFYPGTPHLESLMSFELITKV